jgi:hypothetical protein
MLKLVDVERGSLIWYGDMVVPQDPVPQALYYLVIGKSFQQECKIQDSLANFEKAQSSLLSTTDWRRPLVQSWLESAHALSLIHAGCLSQARGKLSTSFNIPSQR